MKNCYEFYNPVRVISGALSVKNHLGKELKKLGGQNVFIISGPVLNKLGVVEYIAQILRDEELSVGGIFTNIPNDSKTEIVCQIAKEYTSSNCDCIVAVGGGSVLDTAKAAKLLISQNSVDYTEFFGYNMSKIGIKVPFVAIPTTCGTGSEVTKVSVIYNENNCAKEEIISTILLPDIAILEPLLLKTLPAKSVLLTAFDALAHAIEGYCGKAKNPISDKYSLLAIKYIYNNLGALLDDISNGKNLNINNSDKGNINYLNCLDEQEYLKDKSLNNLTRLLEAACFAGISFSNSMVGGVHAIAHSVGSSLKVGHDFAVATLLPYVLKYNLEYNVSEYTQLYTFLSGKKQADQEATANAFVQMIYEFFKENCAKIGGISTFSECGLDSSKYDEIIKLTLSDGAILTNSRILGYNDIVSILDMVQENVL